MKISEVFNSDVKGKVVGNTNNRFITRATIGNRDIKFTGVTTAPGIWEIDFIEQSNTKGDTFNKSGSGNELQVFSFVIESLKELISAYHPDEITFDSHIADGNRSSLYYKMGKRLKIPGYIFADPVSNNHSDIFRIIRKK